MNNDIQKIQFFMQKTDSTLTNYYKTYKTNQIIKQHKDQSNLI